MALNFRPHTPQCNTDGLHKGAPAVLASASETCLPLPRSMNKSRLALALLLVLVLLGVAAWYYRPQLDENLAPVVPQAQPV